MTCFHDANRGLLEALRNPDAVAPLLRGATGADAVDGWSFDWGRVVDAASGRVQAVYTAPCAPTCVIEAWGSLHPTTRSIYRLTDDPRLDTLARVLRRAPNLSVVRYRPGKRCMLSGSDRAPFVKVFNDGRGARMFEEAQALWRAARRDIDVDVACPISYEPALRALTHARVDGVSIAGSLRRDGGVLARRLGSAAASIAVSPLVPRSAVRHGDELDRSCARAVEIAALIPAVAPRLERVVFELGVRHGRLPERPLRPTHGSPHMSQWLLDGDDLALVDFDRFSWADPELDVATFVGEYTDEATANVPAVIEGFVAGYCDTYGALDPKRLDLYRCHKRIAKAYRVARSFRPDVERRVTRHLDEAMDVLQGAETVA